MTILWSTNQNRVDNKPVLFWGLVKKGLDQVDLALFLYQICYTGSILKEGLPWILV
ncbi:hypothetical protein LCUFL03_160011 [Latilactobacillus curvatus]|nr:hypothetical protein LCUFL03_160011 [Latilactobacillus curvatus]